MQIFILKLELKRVLNLLSKFFAILLSKIFSGINLYIKPKSLNTCILLNIIFINSFFLSFLLLIKFHNFIK